MPKTRPQEPFYKRVQDLEKKAKALEQDREEQQDTYDINEFFEQPGEQSVRMQPVINAQSQQFYALDSNMSLGGDHNGLIPRHSGAL